MRFTVCGPVGMPRNMSVTDPGLPAIPLIPPSIESRPPLDSVGVLGQVGHEERRELLGLRLQDRLVGVIDDLEPIRAADQSTVASAAAREMLAEPGGQMNVVGIGTGSR